MQRTITSTARTLRASSRSSALARPSETLAPPPRLSSAFLQPGVARRWQSSSDASSSSQSASGDAASTPAGSDAAAPEQSPSAEAAKGPDPSEQKDRDIAQLKDRLLRSMADYENLQKTTTRDKANARDFALTSFARDIIGSIDVLSLALNSVDSPKRTDRDTNPDLVNLYEGVALTKVEIEKVLAKHGVVQFDPTGEKFDPNVHEAMYQAPVPGKEPGTVLECQKVGYKIKDRLLRPAQVGVVLESGSA